MEIEITDHYGKPILRKLFLYSMRTFIFLLCTTVFGFSVETTFSQDKVTVNADKVLTVDEVFDLIKTQTKYRFIYPQDLFENAPKVSLDKGKFSVELLLQKAVKKEDFNIILGKNDRIMIKPKSLSVQRSVTGTVTDNNGVPLQGVTVLLKGTTRGTLTDYDGQYRILVADAEQVLAFSYVGFKPQEVVVGGRSSIDLTMEEDVSALDEVVVNAGYYNVKQREATGSIEKVTAAVIENQPVANVLGTVQGRMAGVHITQNSGVPGGGYSVQIRGVNSLRRTGNYPMYIIDGVPITVESPSRLSGAILPNAEINPLNAIHPNDIESIEILKDADATAIYGSRGANGVVLVTTKRAQSSGRTRLEINSSFGMSTVANQLKMMNTPQYLEMRREAFQNDGYTEFPTSAYDVNGTWDQNRQTDWQDNLLGRTATNSSIQTSLSGGDATTSYLVSASHTEQTTVFDKGFRYKSNNLSGNVKHVSADRKLQLSVTGLFTIQDNNVINEDITTQALRLSPNAPSLYTEEGSLNWENNTFTNPIASYFTTYSNTGKSLNTNVNVSYEVLPDLTVGLSSGINYQNFQELVLRPHTTYNPSYGLTPASSVTSKGNNERFSYVVEPQLNYTLQVGKHGFDFLLGGTYQNTESNVLNVSGSGFESNSLMTNLAAASRYNINLDNSTAYRYAALFARLNYNFDGKYIVNLTGRRDGSSRFGPQERFSNFGAVGAGWIFSNERWFQDLAWLSHGKLRGSMGVTGSDAIGDYQYLDSYSIGSGSYDGVTALYPARLFNPYFSWEKTTKFEVAMELGFVQDRINLSTVWYKNRSGNQLVGIPLPGTTGYTSVQSNLPATIENKGWEFQLAFVPVSNTFFRWHSSFNISVPQNELVSFPDLAGSTYANQYIIGRPTSILQLYNYEGIDPETGVYTFTDQNGDEAITSPEDNTSIVEIGTKYFGGWSNRLTYKNWDLSFLFQFVDQKQRNYNALTPTPGTMFNQPVEMLDVWSVDNPNGQYMPYTAGYDSEKLQAQSLFLRSTAAVGDASYIRLKNIQVSYRLPQLRKVPDIKLYIQGQNLLTITDYFGLDPEFVLTGYLPPMKTIAFGAQINF